MIKMMAEVKEARKDGLIYFNPYWEVDMETYMNSYPGCDALVKDVEGCNNLIRVYVCASSVDNNDALLHIRMSNSSYSNYVFWNNSSAYEMGEISSVF